MTTPTNDTPVVADPPVGRPYSRFTRFAFGVTAIAFLVAGCSNLPIGGPPASDGSPPPGPPPPSEVGESIDGPQDDPTTDQSPADPENRPPIPAVASMFGDGPDEILDGRSDAVAFLDASASQDPDGTIVTWEWFIDRERVAVGETATLSGFPVGVTDVTLGVTDDEGAQASADIRVINPGFRPGIWRGTTAQGFDITFEVSDDYAVTSAAFGFTFEGTNLLNDAPCTFSDPAELCGACPTSAERCAFDATWGDDGAFSIHGTCIESGDPPYESARGTAGAAPISNCAGTTQTITWQASWQAPPESRRHAASESELPRRFQLSTLDFRLSTDPPR